MKKEFSLRQATLVCILMLPFFCSAQGILEMMGDILPGTESSTPESLTAFKNKVYFFGRTDASNFGRSLCVSDGTPDGTKVILPLPVDSLGFPEHSPLVIGDKLYFFTKTFQKSILWVSDGTTGGTIPILTQYAAPNFVTVFKGNLWFSTNKQIQYFDVNQNAVVDFYMAESSVENLTSAGDYLYWFSQHALTPYASENKLYRSTGQPGSVQFLQDVGQNGFSTSGSTNILKNARYENGHLRWHTLAISHYNGGTYYGGVKAGMDDAILYTVTGFMSILASAITDSTYFLYTIDNYGSSSPPYASNWQLLAASPGASFQKVMADTAQIWGESVQATSDLLVATSKQIFFRMWMPDTQAELGISDGSITGTRLVKDINPGPYQSSIRNFTVCGDNILFAAFDGTEYGIWYSDGTESGTQKIAPMPNGYQSTANQSFLLVGDALFISIYTVSRGTELWKLSQLPCSMFSQSTELEEDLNFRLSPNPCLPGNTHLLLNESIKPPFQLRLSAMTGNILWQKQINVSTTDIEIPTNFLAAGIYFVTLEKEGGSMTKKLMLMR
ncbi:MAG: T9SS type A sorting domain-containing protein [Phycisphaerae bacterium]|nr:T9SS type A sorting domain-containing protein [Saprospiraceae bacterium]